jgi:hypothetical protein
MNVLNSEQVSWLSKCVRDSWFLDEGKIYVKGNVHLSDSSMQKLPLVFSTVTGTFRCFNCTSLVSVESFPDAQIYIFENCALPSEWYIQALQKKISIEEYLAENFIEVHKQHPALLEKHFQSLCNLKRGSIAGGEFGF